MAEDYEIESVAFDGPNEPYKGFTIKASYLKAPNAGDALCELKKDGVSVRKFLWPAYKVWNIAAHFEHIVDGELENSASGYAIGGSTGLEGLAS